MCTLQYFTISLRPASVVGVDGGGGGVARGDVVPGGKTSWIAGGTAAANISVICSGVTNDVRSAILRAALAWNLCAALRSENTTEINSHTSLLGRSCCGKWLVMAPSIVSNSGIVHFSSLTADLGSSGVNRCFIRLNSWSSLSSTDVSTVGTSASVAFCQTVVKAFLYDVMKFS